ncbi:MAG: hypothetical protein J7L45_03580, partial [Candidatus Aenigmarchaeota archaeon]|nr:hypothetical protein [Candidatus Aenigmarchaeota archaeon]
MHFNRFLALLIVAISLIAVVRASTQLTTTLNIQSPTFIYEETQLNDGSTFANYFEFDYPNQTGGNEIYYVKLPKNSTILNAILNVTGKITTVYKTDITAGTNSGGLLQIDVSNITSRPGNEISIGTQTPTPNVFVVSGSDGEKLWDYSTGYISVTGCYVDDLTDYPGNEIAFVYGVGAGKVGTVEVLNCNDTAGTMAWKFSADDEEGRSIAVGNVDNKGKSEVVYATLQRIYLLNGSTGEEIRNISAPDSETPNIVYVGNVSCYSGNQILVGTTKRLHIYDENFNELWNSTDLGTINSIDMGDILDDPGDEIAIGTPWGTNQGKLYLFNTSGPEPKLVWNVTMDSPPKDVRIGDAVGESPGNEIVIGDQNSNVYTFDRNGTLIWKY